MWNILPGKVGDGVWRCGVGGLANFAGGEQKTFDSVIAICGPRACESLRNITMEIKQYQLCEGSRSV